MNVLQKGVLPLGVAAVLMLGGCGSASPKAAPVGTAVPPTSGATSTATTSATTGADAAGGQVDACALLTQQDLKPILGDGVDAGSDTSSDTTAACAYTGAGVVTVVVDPEAKSTFDTDCSTGQPQPNIQAVNGLADGACLTVVGGAIGAVYVLKGDDVMSINVQAGSTAALTPDALIALGTSAAGRL